MRGLQVLALSAASLGCAGVASAGEQPPAGEEVPSPDQPKKVRNGFSAKLAGGPSVHWLHGHVVGGGRFHAAFGAQLKDIAAIHGEFSYGVGRTDGGLMVHTGSLAATWEFILDSWRLGFGPELTIVSMRRYTAPELVGSLAGGFMTSAGVDLVQGETYSLHLGLEGRYGWLSQDVGYGGLGLFLGGRMKAP